MNALNSGCGSIGLDLNSGWNWQPRYHGWSAISQISTYVLSGVSPVMRNPAAFSRSLVFAIEFVAVAMPLADLARAVGAASEAVFSQPARPARPAAWCRPVRPRPSVRAA